MNLPNKFLSNAAQFIKMALDLNEQYQDELAEMKKQAAIREINQEKYRLELKKAATDLYEADFLTDDLEKRQFIRKAAEDPCFVVKYLSKLSQAADVAQLGRPARIKSASKDDMYANDPVYQKAFGISSNGGDLVDD